MPRKCSERFSHYTTFKSVKGIFKSGKFFFSNISQKSNDLQEKALVQKIESEHENLHLYYACFCSLKEYIPLWKIYSNKANDNSDDDFDAMIYFILKDDKTHDDFFNNNDNNKPKCNQIIYKSNREFKKLLKGNEVITEDEIGFIKTNYWKYEKEIRFLLKSDNNSEKVPIKINFEALKSIEIYIKPIDHKPTLAVRNEIKEYFAKHSFKNFHVHKRKLDVIFASPKKETEHHK